MTTISDETFDAYVNDDVRGYIINPEDPEHKERLPVPEEVTQLLRSPEHVVRWHNALLGHKSSVEAQLSNGKAERANMAALCWRKGAAGKQEWLDYVAKQEKWRAGALRFRNGVDVKLTEAKQLMRSLDVNVVVEEIAAERNEAIRRVVELETAILTHQSAVDAADEDDAITADEDLWNQVAKR